MTTDLLVSANTTCAHCTTIGTREIMVRSGAASYHRPPDHWLSVETPKVWRYHDGDLFSVTASKTLTVCSAGCAVAALASYLAAAAVVLLTPPEVDE